MIGVAGHICAASPGGRRYDASMTAEQRAHISNGIWLCQSCGTLVDRDEVRFTAHFLRAKRQEHEEARRIGASSNNAIGDIVGFAGIIATGNVIRSTGAELRVRLSHFVEGSASELLNFAHQFDEREPNTRYVLLNELGSGGILDGAPLVERRDGAYEVQFRIAPSPLRRDASKGVDIDVENGQTITGLPVYLQNIERTLGMARGTWFFEPKSGSDLSDLYWRYQGSPWFARLAMMEAIRLSCIPSEKPYVNGPTTPFACVNRVRKIEVPSFDLQAQRLKISAEFELEGFGTWSGELSVFISTPEQLAEGRRNAQEHHRTLQEIEGEYGPNGSFWNEG